ncbi:MAG: hypothetical protein HY403_00590 [Elusimicrobia bacterium]|nr:hypothetical protein [Elusimicrobiota bacterium]
MFKRLIPAFVAMIAGFSAARAAPAKAPPFSTQFYGEGGGYKHPDRDVGPFLETKPPAQPLPERPPRPRPFIPGPAADAGREAPSVSKAGDEEGKTLDSASEDARRDYETRLLGEEPASRRPELSDPARLILTDPAPSAATGEGMLFVSLELDPNEAGALRDAVAGLGAAAAFRPDARFQPLPGEGGSVRISGWLPASRLGDAIARPGVRRVAVERGSRPVGDDRVTGGYLLKLRVAGAARSEEALAASVRALTADVGFKLDRVFPLESVPGGGATVLASGTMPVSRLSRALGLPGVLEVQSAVLGLPTPALSAAADVPAAGKPSAKKDGFIRFVMARGPWLILLTALLALPAFGRGLKSALAVFVPYR